VEQAYRVSPSSASASVSTQQPELAVIENVQAQIWEGIEQHVKGMVRTLVEQALAAEAGAQVTAAPYERSDERTGYRNGSYRRDLMTRYGPIEKLRVPRVQLLDGSPPPAYQTFDRWERRTPDLERAIGQMFVLGISTRKLRSLCSELWGAPVSSATVSRVTQALDYDVDAFLSRAIEDDIEYLYLDGITAKLRDMGIEGKVMLVALGVHRDGTIRRRERGDDPGAAIGDDHPPMAPALQRWLDYWSALRGLDVSMIGLPADALPTARVKLHLLLKLPEG